MQDVPDDIAIGTETAESVESVGARIRQRRKAKRMTLRQVAEATGLAEGFLSQLERGLSGGSVSTLQKVSAVLGLTVGDLFVETWSSTPEVNLETEAGTQFGIRARKVRLTPKSFDQLEVFVGFFGPYGCTSTEPYSHGSSEETIVVLDGAIILTLGDTEKRLTANLSMAYSSEIAHRVSEADGNTAKVLWAIAPPSY